MLHGKSVLVPHPGKISVHVPGYVLTVMIKQDFPQAREIFTPIHKRDGVKYLYDAYLIFSFKKKGYA